ncbi:MAG TPA: D-alanyl-D-alanine dipeptidase [Chlorobiota bacterium]|nr:D-alanyl-D-alanine dipeptidase [Chlorobiota bacterium]
MVLGLFSVFVAAITMTAGPASPSDMVVLQHEVPELIFDVRYATENNFTHRVLYSDSLLKSRRHVADSLKIAVRLAAERGYRIKIFDAYRPVSVQRFMWSLLPDERYVADPAKGSRHNRGCAVDVTLCTLDGKEVDMGTDYDEFTERAHADANDISQEQAAHRAILRGIMNASGFDVLPTEWWHFDLRGWEQYPILEE